MANDDAGACDRRCRVAALRLPYGLCDGPLRRQMIVAPLVSRKHQPDADWAAVKRRECVGRTTTVSRKVVKL